MKYIVICFLLFCLTGCIGPAYDTLACREAVIEEMDTEDVTTLPKSDYSFVVRQKDNSVWIVKCLSSKSASVTEKILIFKGR